MNMTTMKPVPGLGRLEVGHKVCRVLRDVFCVLGVVENDEGRYEMAEVENVVGDFSALIVYATNLQLSLDESAMIVKIMDYIAARQSDRRMYELAAEIQELARWVSMPNKLVRDDSGRSIGSVKVPRLTAVKPSKETFNRKRKE